MIDLLACGIGIAFGWLSNRLFLFLRGWEGAGLLSLPHVVAFIVALAIASLVALSVGRAHALGVSDGGLIAANVFAIAVFVFGARSAVHHDHSRK